MKALTLPTIFKAVDKFSAPVNKMAKSAEASMSRLNRSMRKISQTAFDVSKRSALMGAAIIAPMVLFANEAVSFEDKMADVGKTTGLADEKLASFGEGILDLSKNTRTSINDLSTIAEIGGQLGIAEKDLLSFTEAADKFNIALGADFGGVDEAVSQVGKIKMLFDQTRGLDISEAINKTGSAINELGAMGAGTSANITDFTLRLGALPDALKPSIENTLALGTLLEEVGINSQIGAGGLSKILLVAGTELDGFAKQMNITEKAASELLSTDPTGFLQRFSKSFEGLGPEALTSKLKDLGINSQESIKVLGALGAGTERLTELQLIASEAFAAGTSLQDEAAKKNATTAAQMAIAKNNMQSLAITLGTTLLPILNELLQTVSPIMKSFAEWAKNNQDTVSTIMKVAGAVAGLMFAVSAVSAVVGAFAKVIGLARYGVAAYNIVLGVMGALSGTASIAIGKSNVAMKAYAITTKVVTIATKAWGMAMKLASGPLGWIIIGVGALAAGAAALSKAFSSVSDEQRLYNEVQERALENSIEQRAEVTLLFKTLRKAEEGSSAYNKTLERLNEIQPGIIDKYNLQAKSLEAINAAEEELIGNIMKRAREEARAQLMTEKMKRSMALTESANKLGEGGIFSMDDELRSKMLAEAAQLENDVSIIADQQIEEDAATNQEVVAPAITQQRSLSEQFKSVKETLTIDFKNLPPGVEVSGTGSTSINMPTIGSTRG